MQKLNWRIFLPLFAIYIICFFLPNAQLFSQSFQVIESNGSKLKLRFKADITNIEDININGIDYKKPNIKDAQNFITVDNQGAPAYLTVLENFIIPSPQGFKLKSFKVNKTITINGILYPNSDISTIEFKYNPIEEKYKNYSAPNPIEVNYKGIAGDRYIADISIHPIIYNNRNKEIEIITEAEIEIDFDDTYAKYTDKKFDMFLISVLNAKTAPNWYAPDEKRKNTETSKYDILQNEENFSWGKIKIDKEGIYYLNISDLNNAGFNINSNNAKTIRIYGYGGEELTQSKSLLNFNDLPEQEFYLQENNSGTPEKIIFYAAGIKGITTNVINGISYDFIRYINAYSNENYYLISVGGQVNPKINPTPVEIPESSEMRNLLSYEHYLYDEEDIFNPGASGTGRKWFGKSFFPITISHKLYNLDRNGTINYYFTGAYKVGTNVSSSFKFYENSKQIYSVNNNFAYDRLIGTEAKFETPAINIASDDRSTFKIDFDIATKNSFGQAYMDYYIIKYPRSFNAIENELNATIAPKDVGLNQITAVNFSSDKIYGWDISNRMFPIIIKNHSTTPSIFIIRNETSYNSGNHFYLSSAPHKAQIEKINIANIRNENEEVDMLLVTHPDLLNSAEQYAKYRTSRGIKTKVYTTTDLFNEFGAGVPGPYSIRNFVSYKLNNASYKPKYLYLWGGTHYDYRNIVEKETNFVPIFEGLDGEGILSNNDASDELYAYAKGNDYLMDIAIGRAPIESNDEGIVILNKMMHYENNSSTDDWRNIFTILADDSFAESDKGESVHTYQSESLASLSSLKDFQINKIYSAQFPTDANSSGRRKSKVTSELLNSSNKSGNVILTYIGHGNPRVLAHEEIFERDKTTPLFQNLDKLFFFYTATCDFAYIDLSQTRSGAEELFKHKHGGAIALYSTTRSVTINENGALVNEFFKNILNRDDNNQILPIGSIVSITRNNRNSNNNNNIIHNDALYILIGDPSLQLLIPELTVKIESINDILVDSVMNKIELKGLEKVKVKGKILNPNGEINSDFNGSALINLFDASEKVSFTEQFGANYTINKLGNALSKNSTEVINGNFEIDFIIPKDISFADGNAKLAVFAVKNDSSQTAMGSTERISIRSIDETAVIENNGPMVNLFLENRKFISGDQVTPNPLLIVDLSDESGINTAGAGIGHKIEAWLDESAESIDLTHLYKSSFHIPNSGTIEKIIENISPGLHSIKVRAWDVYNNYTVSYTDFKVGDNSGTMILNTYMYPNPIIESGHISITHSITSGYDIIIKISDINGKIVKEINKPGTSLNTAIAEWDGKDNYGLALPEGSYFYTVMLKTKTETANSFGKFMLIK